MESMTLFLCFIIFIALVFDFINGFHDAANSIATIVTTKVLTPRQAVFWAAFFNFIAFLVFNLTVAHTIGEGLIAPEIIDGPFILSALCGAILWNLLTWYFGLPSSSSHALIGGLAGAALLKGGFGALKLSGFLKVIAGIFISPILGLCIGLLLTYLLKQLLLRYRRRRLQKIFRVSQLITSAMLSLSHGSNDAQKTMGIITMLLFSYSVLQGAFHVPLWVVLTCQTAISLGTLAGGWRIVHTMGTKITKLNAMKGCAAESGAALSLFIATWFGIPVSTTHTVTGAITGVGLIHGFHGSRWSIIITIFCSWLLTVPASALMAALILCFF
ncbi:MAG: anion permease [Legionella sp. 40-6]|nr:inorganic phosphate transporter [Legionella sp.]OJY46287.1 MAG: anion permease [Legionella sp. 40-6]